MKAYDKYPRECEQLLKVCQRLYNRNMLAAADGNVSLRIGDEILITPSGVSKAFMQANQVALITPDDQILSGQPSSERLMHLAVYNTVPEAKAVVHAHPPHAIAWSVAFPEDRELPATCLSELILATGRVPIVPYTRPGTHTMGEALIPFLPERKVMVLSRHGGLCWGETLDEAMMGMERLEHTAEILYRAQTLKGLSHLNPDEVAELDKLRQQIGNRSL